MPSLDHKKNMLQISHQLKTNQIKEKDFNTEIKNKQLIIINSLIFTKRMGKDFLIYF